jgi:hypothetical protein
VTTTDQLGSTDDAESREEEPLASSPQASRLTSRVRRIREDPAIRMAGMLWICSKVALLTLSWTASWALASGKQPTSWPSLWEHWDATLLRDIAQYGYLHGPSGTAIPNQFAFFPGYPLVLAAVHALVSNWTAAELLISAVASFVAILQLIRIAEDERPGTESWTGVIFLLAPAAIFLSVGYTESLFLAFALPAWRAGTQGRWAVAAVLTGLASAVRVNGVFLGLALGVLACTRFPGARRRGLAWLLVAALPVLGYGYYLKATTGSWLTWFTAEKSGWSRGFHNPGSTFATTWAAAFGHTQSPAVALMFQLELLATAALLATAIMLLATRRWAEALYCALTLFALASGTWYESVPRALLLMWPLWCGLGRLAARSRLAAGIIVAVSAPFAFITAMLYLAGSWAG